MFLSSSINVVLYSVKGRFVGERLGKQYFPCSHFTPKSEIRLVPLGHISCRFYFEWLSNIFKAWLIRLITLKSLDDLELFFFYSGMKTDLNHWKSFSWIINLNKNIINFLNKCSSMALNSSMGISLVPGVFPFLAPCISCLTFDGKMSVIPIFIFQVSSVQVLLLSTFRLCKRFLCSILSIAA